jgi:hypothetical protein
MEPMKDILAWSSSKAKRLSTGNKEIAGWLHSLCTFGRINWFGTSILNIRQGGITITDIDQVIKHYLKDTFLPIMHANYPQLKKPFTGKLVSVSRGGDRIDEVHIVED